MNWDVASSVLVTGVFTSAVSVLTCLTFREQRLLNLSSASIACAGGWLLAWALPAQNSSFSSHGKVALAILLCFVVGLQIAMPFFFSRRLAERPALFLFVTLAGHVILSTVGSNLIPVSRSSFLSEDIAFNSRFKNVIVLCCACCVSFIAVAWIQHSKTYATRSLQLRKERAGGNVTLSSRLYLVGLQLIQVLALLGLGTVSIPVHNGSLSATNTMMVTIALSTIASRGVPIRAALIASILSTAQIFFLWVAPLGHVALPISLALLMLWILIKEKPIPPIAFIAANPHLSHHDGKVSMARQLILIFSCTLLGVIAWKTLGLSDTRMAEILLLFVFSFIAFVSIKCCGMFTATWPVFGAILCYFLARAPDLSWFWILAGFGMITTVFVLHLFAVRYMSPRFSLVFDLATVVSLHQFAANFTLKGEPFLGSEHTLFIPTFALAGTPSSLSFVSVYVLLLTVAAASMAMLFYFHHTSPGRVIVHGMSDVLHAAQHGLRINRWLGGSICFLLLSAFLAQWFIFRLHGSISLDASDPIFGIGILFVGYVMSTESPFFGFISSFVLMVATVEVLQRFGISGQYREASILVPIIAAIAHVSFVKTRECP